MPVLRVEGVADLGRGRVVQALHAPHHCIFGPVAVTVVITGLPGSGKSTLGALLAPEMALPLLDKDRFLEALLAAFPTATRTELSRKADELFQARALELQRAILVSWWKHPLSTLPSGTPVGWLSQLPGGIVEVRCDCAPQLAADRYRARALHRKHADNDRAEMALLDQFPQQESLGALGLFPVVRVDSAAPFSIPDILNSITQASVTAVA